jgi:predicted lipoprotein with Yx(FWY)xxD motif
MRRPISAALGLPALLLAVAACSTGATVAPTSAPATSAPATSAPASTGAGAGGATVNATSVGSAGTILVDGTSGMTLYVFAKDTRDSGTSACTGDCLVKWPALTVAAGGTPTGGSGVAGKLATITRPDDGTLQVTYNGLPLYFFANDKAAGDLNGVYENWMTVAP